ncbi:hypothetical protein BAE44_0012525 [Dichanthelium oligosanthes]|uniref:Uncharacterized protein n=1 Tax=Dichanthelium oligosanthes TaxID=888268 RepID=A0A1E5VN06_9POAL|nr:hypothetical protein BAE44_0012525 [Dichanthelium oligosanthes]
MGNCAVTQHAVTSWADDGEWEVPSAAAADEGAGTTSGRRKEHAAAEVTIRITRKQLQELMEKRAGGLKGLKSRRAAAQLLADVMNAGQVYHHLNHCKAPHWRPALQSIPEAVDMGNCLKLQRAAVWADGDEWEEEVAEKKAKKAAAVEAKVDHRVEVKIRVTKRQLQELLEKAGGGRRGDCKAKAAEKVLAELMTSGMRVAESWADDGEWEEEASSEEGDHHHHYHERGEEHASEVTIRITKRQLHELMEKSGTGGHGLQMPGLGSRRSTEQLLADIMNSGEVHHHRVEHWHWKPALQSIPEAVES